MPDHVTVHMLDLVGKIIKMDNKPLFISVLHYLYEAQDPSLCQFVVNQQGHKLDANSVSLTPVDSLSILLATIFLVLLVLSTCSKWTLTTAA